MTDSGTSEDNVIYL